MQNRFLNNKEIKKIRESFLEEYGYFWQEDYAYVLSEKERLSIISKDIAAMDLKQLRIDKIGLYVAEIKNNQVRLSKEGAQLLAQEAGKHKIALKNIHRLSAKEVQDYFKGLDLAKELGAESKLIILQHHDNVIGCARYKDGKILNFLPKIHRGEVIL
ncbi:MAG TPA: hypothetical protein VJH68_04065 [Candidatus Nanoarchaeia archaeon]|nr:hypothetical protein [Candidatus Nanoarchaeia archaeon]